jgi:DNA-binding MarR family transcriptional regulator
VQVTERQYKVLLAYANHALKHGFLPPRHTIADETGLNENSIGLVVHQLERKGLIKKMNSVRGNIRLSKLVFEALAERSRAWKVLQEAGIDPEKL